MSYVNTLHFVTDTYRLRSSAYSAVLACFRRACFDPIEWVFLLLMAFTLLIGLCPPLANFLQLTPRI